MKSLLLAQLIVGLVLASSIDAEAGIIRGRRYPLNFDVPNQAPVVALPQPLVEERITNLPEDGGMCYLTVFTSANPEANPKEKQLLDNLRTNPTLQRIASQCHFHHIKSDDPLFAGRYLPTVGNVMPAIVMQEPGGDYQMKPFFRRTGSSVPDDGKKLAADVVTAIREHFPATTAKQVRLVDATADVRPIATPAVAKVQSPEAKVEAGRPFHRPKPDDTPAPCPNPNIVPQVGPNTNVIVAPPDVGAVEEDEQSGSVDMMTLGVVAGVIVFLVAGVLVFLGKSGVFG